MSELPIQPQFSKSIRFETPEQVISMVTFIGDTFNKLRSKYDDGEYLTLFEVNALPKASSVNISRNPFSDQEFFVEFFMTRETTTPEELKQGYLSIISASTSFSYDGRINDFQNENMEFYLQQIREAFSIIRSEKFKAFDDGKKKNVLKNFIIFFLLYQLISSLLSTDTIQALVIVQTIIKINNFSELKKIFAGIIVNSFDDYVFYLKEPGTSSDTFIDFQGLTLDEVNTILEDLDEPKTVKLPNFKEYKSVLALFSANWQSNSLFYSGRSSTQIPAFSLGAGISFDFFDELDPTPYKWMDDQQLLHCFVILHASHHGLNPNRTNSYSLSDVGELILPLSTLGLYPDINESEDYIQKTQLADLPIESDIAYREKLINKIKELRFQKYQLRIREILCQLNNNVPSVLRLGQFLSLIYSLNDLVKFFLKPISEITQEYDLLSKMYIINSRLQDLSIWFLTIDDKIELFTADFRLSAMDIRIILNTLIRHGKVKVESIHPDFQEFLQPIS